MKPGAATPAATMSWPTAKAFDHGDYRLDDRLGIPRLGGYAVLDDDLAGLRDDRAAIFVPPMSIPMACTINELT